MTLQSRQEHFSSSKFFNLFLAKMQKKKLNVGETLTNKSSQKKVSDKRQVKTKRKGRKNLKVKEIIRKQKKPFCMNI